jgi:hypothetical protein
VLCEHDDDGSLLIRARLPAEEGALVVAALEAGRDALREGPPAETSSGGGASAETTHIGDTPAAEERAAGEREAVSNADALLLMSQTLLASGPAERTGGDSYEVVVHVDVDTLAGEAEGGCGLEQGPPLSPETARRLACDASVVRMLERDGRPLSVGRRTRSVPPALRRALRNRDHTCRFPGCTQRRFLHAHHVEHWARGGPTDLTNLVHLCAFHHRLVHEGGYAVDPSAGGGLLFRRPDGRALDAGPPRRRGESRALERRHRRTGLTVDHAIGVSRTSHQPMQVGWVVGGLAEADPRLRE